MLQVHALRWSGKVCSLVPNCRIPQSQSSPAKGPSIVFIILFYYHAAYYTIHTHPCSCIRTQTTLIILESVRQLVHVSIAYCCDVAYLPYSCLEFERNHLGLRPTTPRALWRPISCAHDRKHARRVRGRVDGWLRSPHRTRE